MATIGLVQVENPLEFGIVITHDDGTIERFLEKPTWGQVFSDKINSGIYVLDPAIFDHIDADRSVDFSSEVFPKLLADGEALYGALGEGYWEDVGTLEAYLRAHHDVLDQRALLDISGFQISEGIWLGEGAEVSPDAQLLGPAVIGPGCIVEAGSRLGEYVVLGSNVRVLGQRRPRAGAWSTTTSTSVRARGCAAPWWGGRRTSAPTSTATRASSSVTRCTSGRTPCSATA